MPQCRSLLHPPGTRHPASGPSKTRRRRRNANQGGNRNLAGLGAVHPSSLSDTMVVKAHLFEVALPGMVASEGGGSSGASSASAEDSGENQAGEWLSFYKQVYMLKVPTAHFMLLH